MRIAITGAAGLVGRNLVARLATRGEGDIVAIDKDEDGLVALRGAHPNVRIVVADLAERGHWRESLEGAGALIIGQAQIGGTDDAEFRRNNIEATRRVLEAAAEAAVPYLVHLSSSVVKSAADDIYVRTKTEQERIVDQSPIPHVVLRPTLMFGPHDAKHLGWLARFMARSPVFPIPGDGRFLRQPLYVRDLCDIAIAAIGARTTGTHNISGQERIDYIDLVRTLKAATGSRSLILPIPYGLFHGLLALYASVSRNPPFTTAQLEALATPDVFEVIDWPAIFKVKATPLAEALAETFGPAAFTKSQPSGF